MKNLVATILFFLGMVFTFQAQETPVGVWSVNDNALKVKVYG